MTVMPMQSEKDERGAEMNDSDVEIKVKCKINVYSRDGILADDRVTLKDAVEFILKNSCAFDCKRVIASTGTFGYFESSEVIPKDRIVDAVMGFFAIPEDWLMKAAKIELERLIAEDKELGVKQIVPREDTAVQATAEIMSREGESGLWITVEPIATHEDDRGLLWQLQVLEENDKENSLLAYH